MIAGPPLFPCQTVAPKHPGFYTSCHVTLGLPVSGRQRWVAWVPRGAPLPLPLPSSLAPRATRGLGRGRQSQRGGWTAALGHCALEIPRRDISGDGLRPRCREGVAGRTGTLAFPGSLAALGWKRKITEVRGRWCEGRRDRAWRRRAEGPSAPLGRAGGCQCRAHPGPRPPPPVALPGSPTLEGSPEAPLGLSYLLASA